MCDRVVLASLVCMSLCRSVEGPNKKTPVRLTEECLFSDVHNDDVCINFGRLVQNTTPSLTKDGERGELRTIAQLCSGSILAKSLGQASVTFALSDPKDIVRMPTSFLHFQDSCWHPSFLHHIHNPPRVQKRRETNGDREKEGQRVNRHNRCLRRAADNDDQRSDFCEVRARMLERDGYPAWAGRAASQSTASATDDAAERPKKEKGNDVGSSEGEVQVVLHIALRKRKDFSESCLQCILSIVGERAVIKQTEHGMNESTAMEDKEKAFQSKCEHRSCPTNQRVHSTMSALTNGHDDSQNIVGERVTIKQTEHGVSELTAMEDKEKAVSTEQTRREDAVSGGGGEVRSVHDERGMFTISNEDEHDERSSSSRSLSSGVVGLIVQTNHPRTCEGGWMVGCGHNVVHRFERNKDDGVVGVDQGTFWVFCIFKESGRTNCDVESIRISHLIIAIVLHAGCIQHINPFTSSRVNPSRMLVPTSTPTSLAARQISTGMRRQCRILRDARAAGEFGAPPISTRPSLLADGTDIPKSHSCCQPSRERYFREQ
ncbi:hypothetical protein BLNAU_7468 [Blattamonas nauphoetae]|uniref:Uncharacterized protein n=1 Tax=Blattamonas nauphoetae TaxID=2049346 RepID=A0ABQ9Y1F5_9EUKA|nr:hypothetical protein BLNAU_7468 [Blattamonas nauphoetae]